MTKYLLSLCLLILPLSLFIFDKNDLIKLKETVNCLNCNLQNVDLGGMNLKGVNIEGATVKESLLIVRCSNDKIST